jgi:uncharacterized protein YndB with AHSA1/START domain
MPKQFRVTRTIAAPAEKIWALLTNSSGYRDWNPSIVSLDGQISQGAKIALVSTINPKRTFKLKVTELNKPTRMVWSSGMPFGLFTGRRTFTMTERGGSTEFSMTEAFTGPLAGLITKAIPDMTESFNQFADGLKSASE